MDLYFTDYFKVNPKDLESYGAFNISLISDLPLFIDPFLLFNSKKIKYQKLHDVMIKYLVFLKDKSATQKIDNNLLKVWYVFKEVKENWLGFSAQGNKGSALGYKFATALNQNLNKIFQNFGNEKITKSSHLEKLCLIRDGVGRDNISDFTTNLIKSYLLEYTQKFAKTHIQKKARRIERVPRVKFNYNTETWEEDSYDLPIFNNDFVLLTPKDIMTKDETWINKNDLLENFERIPSAIPDAQLRSQVNNYFLNLLIKDPQKKKEPTKQEKRMAAFATIQKFSELIDYYIKHKEETGDEAQDISHERVILAENIYIKNVQNFRANLGKQTDFYGSLDIDSYKESKKKVNILKEYIENNDGYKLFYDSKTGKRIKGEKDTQLLFGLVCHQSTPFDISKETNSGRGPVDFKLSMGRKDKTLVEFKLASNNRLKQNLLKQVEIYQKANQTKLALKVIIYFSENEHKRVINILNELGLTRKENIVLIDARKDNKVSASKA